MANQYAATPTSSTQQDDPRLSHPSAADLQRQKREEYKHQLDAQMKQKEFIDGAKVKQEVDTQNAFQKQLPGSSVQHALPQENPAAAEDSAKSRVVARSRTDITSEKQQATEAEQIKKAAYQEELRLQMEQQQKKKEEEKAK